MARAIRVARIVERGCCVAGGIVNGRARVMSYSAHGLLGGIYHIPNFATGLLNDIAYIIGHVIGQVARRIPCVVDGILYGIRGFFATARNCVLDALESIRDPSTQVLQELSYLPT
jgi:hypothetical protein